MKSNYGLKALACLLLSVFLILSCRKTEPFSPKEGKFIRKLNLGDVNQWVRKSLPSTYLKLYTQNAQYKVSSDTLWVRIPTSKAKGRYFYFAKTHRSLNVYAVRIGGEFTNGSFTGKIEWYDFAKSSFQGIKYQQGRPISRFYQSDGSASLREAGTESFCPLRWARKFVCGLTGGHWADNIADNASSPCGSCIADDMGDVPGIENGGGDGSPWPDPTPFFEQLANQPGEMPPAGGTDESVWNPGGFGGGNGNTGPTEEGDDNTNPDPVFTAENAAEWYWEPSEILPPYTRLSTDALRDIWRNLGNGTSDMVTFNRRLGKAFEETALRYFRLSENLMNLPSNVRYNLNGNQLPAACRPDGIQSALYTPYGLNEPQEWLPGYIVTEVKAYSGTLELSTNKYQIAGHLDIISNAVNAHTGSPIPQPNKRPLLFFITTANTFIGRSILDDAYRRGIKVWQSMAFIDQATGNIKFSRPIQLMYGTGAVSGMELSQHLGLDVPIPLIHSPNPNFGLDPEEVE